VKKNHLTVKVFLMIVATDIGESLAELFMKNGLIRAGISRVGWDNLAWAVGQGVSSYLIWLGVLMYVINFLIWIVVLSRVQLSVAFPVGSTSYIFVPLLAMIFLNEHVGLTRWAGIALIIAGIHFVSKSAQSGKV
jgi:drug/metabolite transporter (DMT)-like permease